MAARVGAAVSSCGKIPGMIDLILIDLPTASAADSCDGIGQWHCAEDSRKQFTGATSLELAVDPSVNLSPSQNRSHFVEHRSYVTATMSTSLLSLLFAFSNSRSIPEVESSSSPISLAAEMSRNFSTSELACPPDSNLAHPRGHRRHCLTSRRSPVEMKKGLEWGTRF